MLKRHQSFFIVVYYLCLVTIFQYHRLRTHIILQLVSYRIYYCFMVFTRHRLYLDDFLLLFGLACFEAATYLIYLFSHMIILSNVIKLDFTYFSIIN